jgi:hypothetical protein
MLHESIVWGSAKLKVTRSCQCSSAQLSITIHTTGIVHSCIDSACKAIARCSALMATYRSVYTKLATCISSFTLWWGNLLYYNWANRQWHTSGFSCDRPLRCSCNCCCCNCCCCCSCGFLSLLIDASRGVTLLANVRSVLSLSLSCCE